MDSDIEQRARRSAMDRSNRSLDGAAGTLALAGALVRSGRAIDLGGLPEEIGAICAGVLDLAHEDGRSFRPRLIGLLAALDALSRALETDAA